MKDLYLRGLQFSRETEMHEADTIIEILYKKHWRYWQPFSERRIELKDRDQIGRCQWKSQQLEESPLVSLPGISCAESSSSQCSVSSGGQCHSLCSGKTVRTIICNFLVSDSSLQKLLLWASCKCKSAGLVRSGDLPRFCQVQKVMV